MKLVHKRWECSKLMDIMTVWKKCWVFQRVISLVSSGKSFQCRVGTDWTYLCGNLCHIIFWQGKYVEGWWVYDMWEHKEEWTSKYLSRETFDLYIFPSKLYCYFFFLSFFFSPYRKISANSTKCPRNTLCLDFQWLNWFWSAEVPWPHWGHAVRRGHSE